MVWVISLNHKRLEFLSGVGKVPFGSAFADAQPAGNFLMTQPFHRKKPKHLLCSVGQPLYQLQQIFAIQSAQHAFRYRGVAVFQVEEVQLAVALPIVVGNAVKNQPANQPSSEPLKW